MAEEVAKEGTEASRIAAAIEKRARSVKSIRINGADFPVKDIPEATLGFHKWVKREGLWARIETGDISAMGEMVLHMLKQKFPNLKEGDLDHLTMSELRAVSARIGGGDLDTDF